MYTVFDMKINFPFNIYHKVHGEGHLFFLFQKEVIKGSKIQIRNRFPFDNARTNSSSTRCQARERDNTYNPFREQGFTSLKK